MTSRLLPHQYPAHPADRQTWRVHHCALLSGEWSGKSVKVDPKTGLTSETTWANTYMRFEPSTGQIKGEGVSLWEGQSYPFDIIGAFTPSFSQIELLKTHRNGGVTHLAFAIDLNTYILNGNFINGGTCILQKLPNNPSGGSNVANASNLNYAPLHRQISNSNANAGNTGVATLVPPDLQSFLHLCFPDNNGTASSIYQLLRSQDLHDVESLTAISHEDWKEIGLNLGQRTKIKFQLQRFFPALIPRGGDDANGGAISPSADINNPNAVAGSFTSHYVAAPPQTLFHNNNPNTYAAFASQPPSSSSAASASIQSQQPQQVVEPPISHRCPITHELMEDPVLCSDGHSYDRVAISQWLEMKKTSPITGKILVSKSLQPNTQLKSAIQQWKALHLK